MNHVLRGMREEQPGAGWNELCRRFWPAYESWFLFEGEDQRPSLKACEDSLQRHMPELVSTWGRLSALAGGSERAARLLSLYRPTPYLSGCSQAAWIDGEPALIRNYDFAPHLWEGTLLHTAWHGQQVMAMGDCLWGALDGINASGLAVALAFGGRQGVGDGFGIPLVVRYLLEFCRDAQDARQALERLPSHMAYNVTAIDADGKFFTAQLAPDRAPVVLDERIATNHQRHRSHHQRHPDWPPHTLANASLERYAALQEYLAAPQTTLSSLVDLFRQSPLLVSDYSRGFGTLYTAVYYPCRGSIELWSAGQRVCFDFDTFRAFELKIAFDVELQSDTEELASTRGDSHDSVSLQETFREPP